MTQPSAPLQYLSSTVGGFFIYKYMIRLFFKRCLFYNTVSVSLGASANHRSGIRRARFYSGRPSVGRSLRPSSFNVRACIFLSPSFPSSNRLVPTQPVAIDVTKTNRLVPQYIYVRPASSCNDSKETTTTSGLDESVDTQTAMHLFDSSGEYGSVEHVSAIFPPWNPSVAKGNISRAKIGHTSI